MDVSRATSDGRRRELREGGPPGALAFTPGFSV